MRVFSSRLSAFASTFYLCWLCASVFSPTQSCMALADDDFAVSSAPPMRSIRGLQYFKFTASPWVSRQSIAGIKAGQDIAFRGKLRFSRGAIHLFWDKVQWLRVLCAQSFGTALCHVLNENTQRSSRHTSMSPPPTRMTILLTCINSSSMPA